VTSLQFFFDPACPWTWITSRWVVDVAPHRGLDITWRIFSLRHRNRDNPDYDWIRDELDAQHPAMRVIAAAQHEYGSDAVGRLYTAFGTLIHHEGDDNLDRIDEGIAWAGLDPAIIDAAADAGWDDSIVKSTDDGSSLVGDDAGIPIVAVDGAVATYFGPVLSPAPTGDGALALWDALMTLQRLDGVYEIKRTRDTRPILGARPLVGSR
jgi:hypothetical protein